MNHLLYSGLLGTRETSSVFRVQYFMRVNVTESDSQLVNLEFAPQGFSAKRHAASLTVSILSVTSAVIPLYI